TSGSAIHLTPTLVPLGTEWLLAYASNPMGNFELFLERRAADLSLVGMPSQITSTATREDSPALLATSTTSVLGWVEENMAGTRVLRAQSFDRSLSPTGAVAMLSSATNPPMGVLALRARTDGVSAIWTQLATGGNQAVLQALGSDLTP